MKIKCVKLQCPVCSKSGSCQLFLNKQNQIRYARVRHYSHINKQTRKPQFTYCKLTDLEALKTLLFNKNISLTTDEAKSGQIGQCSTLKLHDHKLRDSSLVYRNKWAGSSARIEHHPPKGQNNIDLNIDLMEYRDYLLSKFSRSYALQMFSKALKYFDCYRNPQIISCVPVSVRGSVLKAMANLAKYLGNYEGYKVRLSNCGVRWVNSDSACNSFLRIVNNNHSNLGEWYNSAQSILRDNERLWLKFNLITGLRKQESIDSLNLIIKLAKQNKLSEYFNEELGILEHFKFADLFFRKTKMVYISIVNRNIISEICNSQPVSYSAMRKRLSRKKLNLRIKELRSYFATYLREHGILAEYIDLLQGRIPKSVFARHYLKVESIKELSSKVLTVTDVIEGDLLS